MPQAKANPHPFESLEYILHVARSVQVLGAIRGSLIHLEVVRVKKRGKSPDPPRYELQVLDGGGKLDEVMGRTDAAEGRVADAAQVESLTDEFPWLRDMFPVNGPVGKCAVLEQLADDLLLSPKYRRWVVGRLRDQLVRASKSRGGADRVDELLAAAHYRTYRHLAGKAAQWAVRATGEKTWLDVALYFAQSEPRRGANEVQGKKVREGTPDTPREFSESSLPVGEEFHFEALAAPASDPADQLGVAEHVARLRACIERLSDVEREVVLAHWFEGASFDACADLVDRSRSQVVTIWQGALEKLRRCLGTNS